MEDLRPDKITRRFRNVTYGSKNYADASIFGEDVTSDPSQAVINGSQDSTIKLTIKDNVCNMDVCWDEDQNIVIDVLEKAIPRNIFINYVLFSSK